jgi:tetratricopeptide (TPR) repeat protein
MPPRVSLCLIVKNEEVNLPACLDSAADLVDEIILVDTGSTDATKEVARRRHAKTFDFPWIDNFAAARNESIRHATGDWIFWMDADDRIDDENRGKLRALIDNLRPDITGYRMQVHSVRDAQTGTCMVGDHIRLFPNHPEIRWKYRVHEDITQAIQRLGGELLTTDVLIHHGGYQDSALRLRKNERNLRLLRMEEEEHPDDPFVLCYLGWTNMDLGRPREALPYLLRTRELAWLGFAGLRKTYALLVNCHCCLAQRTQAFAICQEGRSRFPEDTELLYMEGVLRAQLGDLSGAEACLVYLLGEGRAQAQVVWHDLAIFGHLSRYHLGSVYFQQNRLEEAETQWRAAVAAHPFYTDAWLGLTDLWKLQGQWERLSEVEAAAGRMEADGHNMVDALQLRGRVHMARQEFEAARKLLTEAVALAPDAVQPHTLLSHVLLLEGRDWDAAEQELRTVLRLDPEDPDARRNLGILLERLGRPG